MALKAPLYALALFACAPLTDAIAAPTCTVTGFVRDGINLTAAQINPATVSGDVDATGCNIGVYYSAMRTVRSRMPIFMARTTSAS